MLNIWLKYLSRIAISFSILLNAICGGKTNQTLSATQYDRQRRGLWNLCWIIDGFFFWQDDHCRDAWIKWKIIHNAINRYDTLGEKYFNKKVIDILDDM